MNVLIIIISFFWFFNKTVFAEEINIDNIYSEGVIVGDTFPVIFEIVSGQPNTLYNFKFYGGPENDNYSIQTYNQINHDYLFFDDNWNEMPSVYTDDFGRVMVESTAYIPSNKSYCLDSNDSCYFLFVDILDPNNEITTSVYPQKFVTFPISTITSSPLNPTSIPTQSIDSPVNSNTRNQIPTLTPTPTPNMKIYGVIKNSTSPSLKEASDSSLSNISNTESSDSAFIEAGSNPVIEDNQQQVVKKQNYIVQIVIGFVGLLLLVFSLLFKIKFKLPCLKKINILLILISLSFGVFNRPIIAIEPESNIDVTSIAVDKEIYVQSGTPIGSVSSSPIITDPVVSEDSTDKRESSSLKNDLDPVYKMNEEVSIELFNRDENTIKTTLINENSEVVETKIDQDDENGITTLTINPPQQLRPGKYTLEITDQTGNVIKQNFIWGVLAINPNKSVYLKGETANLAMAVLNERGEMVCDADLNLDVTLPDGTIKNLSTNNDQIKVNSECKTKAITLVPDYQSHLLITQNGRYELKLTAVTQNGKYVINDFFESKQNPDYVIERIASTRIFPSNEYTVSLKITANKDLSGSIIEKVPPSFIINQTKAEISDNENQQLLKWNISLKKGEVTTLKYNYKAREISPEYYLLGPLEIYSGTEIDYVEPRSWQIAVDDILFKIQTGYFMGNGSVKSISGLGFSPQLVVIKSDSNTTAALFKTSSMAHNTAAYFMATADSTAGLITLDSDGFTVTGAAQTALVRYTWTAFAGSDCTSTGNFCVGSFIGTGTTNRPIDVGFQPDLVWVKRSTAVDGTWKTSDMPTNYGLYFATLAQNTAGNLFTTLNATSFGVGATNNVSSAVYNYVAFKDKAGAITTGLYNGNGTSQNITGLGFKPNWLFLKNANIATTTVSNITEAYGNSSSYFNATANVTGAITSLNADGFSVGNTGAVNSVGNTIYWAGFGGASETRNSSGTFEMTNGFYVGNGNVKTITNLSFSPDLVIIKGDTAQAGVFRTKMMASDSSAYLDAATANLAAAITSISPNGFTISNSATVNSVGVTYYWSAYGNAWKPETNSGASDFFIGAYYGNGNDNRNIDRLPFQADLITVKRSGTSAGVFKTSLHVGDTSSYFAATADAANLIQSISSNGFQIGSNGTVNTAANINWYFGFKSGSNFMVGNYSGNGVAKGIGTSFSPDNVWVKRNTAVRGVFKNSSIGDTKSYPFINAVGMTNAITNIGTTGFTVGTAAEVNTSGTNNYWYTAWKSNSVGATSPTFKIQTGYFMGNGSVKSISGLGFSPQLVVIKSDSNTTAALFKTSSMAHNTAAYFMATADSTAGLITLDSDGFTVTGAAQTALVRYTWTAFAGSDCTSTGNFCVGSFIGTGTTNRPIDVGFQPDLVWVKRSTAVDGTWKTSDMPTNYGLYFATLAQNTAGNLFTTLNATSFGVGATNNVSSAVYNYVAFKDKAGAITTGLYNGNGTSQNITGLGFKPNWLFLKNANIATTTVSNITEAYGNSSSYFNATANVTGAITSLNADGFSVGNTGAVNSVGNTIYWAGFGGASETRNSSGTFEMTNGFYVGNGNVKTITNLSFSPDLVIIKGDTAQAGVFRTKMMASDSSAYLDAATANLAAAITSISPNGFTISNSATVNSVGVTYYWSAYGNAWKPETNSGASDFFIGAYYGNGNDNRNIDRLPFQADLITVKRSGTSAGVFKTSLHVGDTSSYFAATADAANLIQSISSNGFQIGSNGTVNTAANINWYFGFKSGSNFMVGNYSGNGVAKGIGTSFSPDNVWVKRNTAVRGVFKNSSIGDTKSYPFINAVGMTNAITNIGTTGFTVGTAAEVNTSGTNNYWYTAWGVQTTSPPNSSPNAPFLPYVNNNNAQSGQQTPVYGLTDHTPSFSAVFDDPDISNTTSNYQLQIGTDSDWTSAEVWDSNKLSLGSTCLENSRCDDIVYGGGTSLLDGTTYYWRIKFWDNFDVGSSWSDTQQFSMNNLPVISNVVLNGGNNIDLTENSSIGISWTATVTDTDGYTNLASTTGKIYRSSVGSSCTPDNNNCYTDASCDFYNCSGNSCSILCNTNVYFFAEATDVGSTFADQYWQAYIDTTDIRSEIGSTISSSTTLDINSLRGFSIDSSLVFGQVFAGSDTGSSNTVTTITNTGNSLINLEITGDYMCTDYPSCGGQNIEPENQQFNLSSFTYGVGTTLSTDPQVINIGISKPTQTPSNSSKNLYWGIGIPISKEPGNYQGSTTILVY